ncbi:hypothetical protein DZA65_02937 [Dickeya dianthicola]|uniref:Uncharacterized protein n=1 Tax=Dickeya dianthicola TaxID=204039 RepID=A0ABX9NJW8_9GAMM|nr:hypothetical protein [Dickeya dianthicola]AYC19815.1 hypothetical protein DZA65_02937 [Dickeya dianthicola]MBI0436449.1 hypothetical protein [Dickeya dianthicola]MBI0447367.1 hypothetical protein [Dickeya dianthicola]MBI0451742.1 hypothetical protein [Dickeya dianthicola]MBI0456197.1 hypothetical protein [Dickeya dianthicola]
MAQLLHGIEIDGQLHFEFSARLPVIGDTVDALAVTHDARGTTTGPAASLFYRVAVTSSVLTLEGVDAEKITPELLLEQLSDDDFDVIDAEIENIKKKRMSKNPGWRATVPPSLLSAATASPKTA